MPPHHQTHLQENQVSSQEASLIDLNPPMHDLMTFDKGNTNLEKAYYENSPSSSIQVPLNEPTCPLLTPPCDPTSTHDPINEPPNTLSSNSNSSCDLQAIKLIEESSTPSLSQEPSCPHVNDPQEHVNPTHEPIKLIEESPFISSHQEPSCPNIVDHEPSQESSLLSQENQEVCQEYNQTHVETSSPQLNQDQNISKLHPFMTYILHMIKVLFMIMTLFVSKFIPSIAKLILFMLTFVIKVLSMIMKNMMILLSNIYGIHDQEVIIPPILPSINTHEQDVQIAPSHPPPTPIHETPTSTCHDETIASHEHISIEDQTNNLDLSEHNEHNQDPNDPSTSTIDFISNPPPYPLGLSTFIHECSSLGQQQPLSTLPSPSNNAPNYT